MVVSDHPRQISVLFFFILNASWWPSCYLVVVSSMLIADPVLLSGLRHFPVVIQSWRLLTRDHGGFASISR